MKTWIRILAFHPHVGRHYKGRKLKIGDLLEVNLDRYGGGPDHCRFKTHSATGNTYNFNIKYRATEPQFEILSPLEVLALQGD